MKKFFLFLTALTLSIGLWAQSDRDTVRLSGNVLIMDKVWNMSTGQQTGWSYVLHEPSVVYIALRTNVLNQLGTFSFEDGTLSDEIYNIIYVVPGIGMKQNSFTSGSMTISEVGDSIVLDGTFLCDNDKVYVLHFTHLISALNEDTDIDFNMNFEYYHLSSYINTNGLITIEAKSKTGIVHLTLFAEPGTKTIPAGEYTISDTQQPGTALASKGIVDEEATGSYAVTVQPFTGDPYDNWFMLSGTITLSYDTYGRLNVAIAAVNSYSRNAAINIAYKPVEPYSQENIDNITLFITKDPKLDNVYDYSFYFDDHRLLAVLYVNTDTLCGNLENRVDLPKSAIQVPGAIMPYYLIDVKPFNVSAEGKNITFNVSILPADSILYNITGTGYIGAIFPDSKENYEGQYTTEDIKLEQVEEGIVLLSGTNTEDDDLALIFSATLSNDGSLAPGDYTDILPSVGIMGEGEVAPSVIIGAYNSLWLIQSGKLTVNADGSMIFTGTNSFDKEVKVTVHQPTALDKVLVKPSAAKIFNGQRFIIRQANKTFDIFGQEVNL